MLTRYLIELIDCFYHLGLKTGWFYWRCMQTAKKDPEFVDGWVRRLNAQAAVTSDEKLRFCYIDFAERLKAARPKTPYNYYGFKAQVLAAGFMLFALAVAIVNAHLSSQWMLSIYGTQGLISAGCVLVAGIGALIYQLASPKRL